MARPARGDTPSLTVVIPAYNAARHVRAAVASALAQEQAQISVVVIDDGSADGTYDEVAALEDPRVTVRRQRNRGPAAARNHGLTLCGTDYVAFLDADDRLMPGWAATVARELAKGCDIVVTDAWIDTDDGSGSVRMRFFDDVPFPAERDQQREILRRNFLISTVATRASLVRSVGGFDEDRALIGVEDWDLYQRLIAAGARAGLVRQPLSVYRRVAGSLSSDVTYMQRAARHLLRLRLNQCRGVHRRWVKSGLRRVHVEERLPTLLAAAPEHPRRSGLQLVTIGWRARRRHYVRVGIALIVNPSRGEAMLNPR